MEEQEKEEEKNQAESRVPGRNGNSITCTENPIGLYWQDPPRTMVYTHTRVVQPAPKIRGATINGVSDEKRDASAWRQVVLEFPSRGTDKSCRGKTSFVCRVPFVHNRRDNLGPWIVARFDNESPLIDPGELQLLHCHQRRIRWFFSGSRAM